MLCKYNCQRCLKKKKQDKQLQIIFYFSYGHVYEMFNSYLTLDQTWYLFQVHGHVIVVQNTKITLCFISECTDLNVLW